LSEVAVVILNWNGINYLKRFLPSVIEHTNPDIADIYIADNGSTDDSLIWLRQNYPGVKIIELDHNRGFAEGYNRSLKHISSEYYLLLNSDVEVTPHWLEPLLEVMESDASIAACMPKIKSVQERSLFEYAGAAGGFIDQYGYPFCRGRIFYHIEADNGQYDNDIEIFWASGACFMVRSELYFTAGGLEPFFFAHMEEIDLCWRLKNHGFRIMFVHRSEVFHLGGGTLPKKNHRKTYLNFRNNLILLIKNLPSGKFLQTMPARIILDFVAAAFFMIKLDPLESFAVLKAYASVLTHLRKIFHLRKETIKKASPKHHYETYPGSIVWQFYIKNKREFSQLKYKSHFVNKP